MKALVPAHLKDAIEEALGTSASRFDLVPYDQDSRILGDSSGSRAFFRWWIPRDDFQHILDGHPDVAWVHTGSVGVDHILTPQFLAKAIPLTNSSGVNAVSMAEWVVGCMIALQKRLPEALERQRRREWEKTEEAELAGQAALFIGGGRVASEIASRLAAFSMERIALTRSGEERGGFDQTSSIDDLHAQLPGADWIIVSAPLTSETEGIIGEAELGLMKREARIVNVARGELIDQDSLVAALRSGRIAGAVLDVFEEEPLPDSNPLWAMPGVIVLPHTTWRSPEAKRRQVALFAENLKRFEANGELLNLVDPSRGY